MVRPIQSMSSLPVSLPLTLSGETGGSGLGARPEVRVPASTRHRRGVHDLCDRPPAANLLAQGPALDLVRASPYAGELAGPVEASLVLRLAGHQLRVAAEGEGETGLAHRASGADAPGDRRQVSIAHRGGAPPGEEQLGREVLAGGG